MVILEPIAKVKGLQSSQKQFSFDVIDQIFSDVSEIKT
jgi:hypothetical protein